MAVDAAEFNALAIDHHHLMLDMDFPQAHRFRNHLAATAHAQGIEIRIFRIPEVNVRQMDLNLVVGRPAAGQRIALSVVEVVLHGVSRRAVHLQVHANRRRFAVFGKLGGHKVVPDVPRIPAQQIDIPEDAGHAQFILILKIAAVAPF